MKPYYEQDGITIYHGDCREILPSISTEPSVTITDPPYGQTALEWDHWVDGWPSLIPGNEMWCFGSMRMFFDNLDDFSSWKFAQDLVWEKHNGSSFLADRFRRVHESVVHFYRGPWSELERNVPTTADAQRRTIGRVKSRPPHLGRIDRTPYASEDGGPRLQRSVIAVRSCHGDAVHPTQKPLGILAPLIAYSAGGVGPCSIPSWVPVQPS